MNFTKIMKNIYKIFIQDEILLRLLYYVPSNQNDDPLDISKENILDKPVKEKFEIIDNTIYFMDKKFKLDPQKSFNRINFYLGERVPYRTYSGGARQLVNNPYISKQEVIFDIYTNMEIHQIDMRLFTICERLNYLLFNKNVGQFIDLKFDYGYTIGQTPDGFVGYRMMYYTLSPQQSSNKW